MGEYGKNWYVWGTHEQGEWLLYEWTYGSIPEWNLAQHTTRTQHTQQFILQLYFSNTTHMLHSCVYTCSHKYTHVELHDSHMTLKIGYF